jgi:hypothetical protein
MDSKKVRSYNITRNFPIFWAVIKILGLFPLAAYTNNHKISRKALMSLTLCNVGVIVCCYTFYFIHVSSQEEKVSTYYKSHLYFILDQFEHFLTTLVLTSIFLSLFIYKNQYGQLVEILKNVDENFQRINHLAMKKVSKKTQILSCGLVSVVFFVLFSQLIHSIIIYENKFGKWPEVKEFLVYNLHFFYKIVALLHFWIVMYEVKKRFNSLKFVLVNISQKSTF